MTSNCHSVHAYQLPKLQTETGATGTQLPNPLDCPSRQHQIPSLERNIQTCKILLQASTKFLFYNMPFKTIFSLFSKHVHLLKSFLCTFGMATLCQTTSQKPAQSHVSKTKVSLGPKPENLNQSSEKHQS